MTPIASGRPRFKAACTIDVEVDNPFNAAVQAARYAREGVQILVDVQDGATGKTEQVTVGEIRYGSNAPFYVRLEKAYEVETPETAAAALVEEIGRNVPVRVVENRSGFNISWIVDPATETAADYANWRDKVTEQVARFQEAEERQLERQAAYCDDDDGPGF